MSTQQVGVSGKSISNFDQESKRLEEEQMSAEAAAFSEQINNLLKKDEKLAQIGLVPIKDSELLYENCRDGILLSKLVSVIKPDAIDLKKINFSVDKTKLNKVGAKDAWEIAQNNNAMLAAAKNVGCKVLGIGAEDIIGKNNRLILAVVWQLIRAHLMRSVNLLSHPELIRLLEGDEKIDKLLTMRSEDIIKRWFNYHLRRAGPDPNTGEIRVVNNFGKDVQSCENWCVLFKQIAPNQAQEAGVDEVMKISDPTQRAEALLEVADKLDCRQFTTAKDIVACRERLNLAFTATIFNAHIGITLPTEAEIERLMKELEDMRNMIVDCLESKAELDNIIQGYFSEQAEILAEIAVLEKGLGKCDNADVRKAELVKMFEENGTGMQSFLDCQEAVNKSDLASKLAEVEAALASFKAYKDEINAKVDTNKQKIADLEGEIADKEQANSDLMDLASGKGNSVDEIKSKLAERESESNAKTALIDEYIQDFINLYHEHDSHSIVEIKGNDEKEKLNSVVEANNKIISYYSALLDERNTEFKRHKEEEQRHVDEMTSQLGDFLREHGLETEDGDAIANLKRLIELMIKKCQGLTLHIQTLQIKIEKDDAKNSVMFSKVKEFAYDRQRQPKKEKKGLFGSKKK